MCDVLVNKKTGKPDIQLCVKATLKGNKACADAVTKYNTKLKEYKAKK